MFLREDTVPVFRPGSILHLIVAFTPGFHLTVNDMEEKPTAESIFGEIADLYDEVRPGYPEELISDLIDLSGISASGRILEIGCGTGKATRLVLPYGRHVTCVDASAGMLAVARQTCSQFQNVEFHESKFEEWLLPPDPFDIAFAAQAFHWIEPGPSLQKIADALRPGGTLAIITSRDIREMTSLRDAIDAAYREFAFDLRSPSPGVVGARVSEMIEASGLFGDVESREYRWTDEYDADIWVKFLSTNSDHRVLPPARLQRLLDAVRSAIIGNGGRYRFGVVSRLQMCRTL
jgi:SAM-dependent methyltransferase